MALKPLTENYWRESVSNYLQSWDGMTMAELFESKAGYEEIREFSCNVLIHLAVSNGFKKFVPGQVWGHELRPGISIHIDDSDVLRHINFGIYMNEWSIETHLPNPESLPYMNDDFWKDIALLPSFGDVELFDSCPINTPPGTPKRFIESKKSVVFQLVRNIIFRKQCDPENAHDVGTLIIKWPIDTPFVELMDKLRSAYGIYYRCVRQLVRHSAKQRKAS